MSSFSKRCEGSPMKHLCAIIRKPQEGKTFICLNNINMNPECFHLIITMNTIKSNLQFFQRAKNRFGENICVFNSKEPKKDQHPDFLHAKDVGSVKKHLISGSNVVIMCAHYKRFEDSILDLLSEISSDVRLWERRVIIHIDEAHEYVKSWRSQVSMMNENSVTERIYMYTATPFSLWVREGSGIDGLFEQIFVVDCEKDFGAKKSEKYFGVKDCKVKVVSNDLYSMVDPTIPDDFIFRFGSENQQKNVREGKPEYWYGTGSKPAPFSLGDEVSLLSHTRFTLRGLKECGRISDDKFSYNFVPGFCRKLTHYAVMEMILGTYPTALVIIINGEGSRFFRMEEEDNMPLSEQLPQMNEPSEQIEDCIQRFPNRPTFISGFHCVGMSVTFINPRIGNFDNVIYSHEHYKASPEILYQLCRFLFNYINWSDDEVKRMKPTRLYVTSQTIVDCCLDYEKQIDKITEEMTGSLRTKSEVQGDVVVKEKKLPAEFMFDALIQYAKVDIKKVTVDDEDEEEESLEKVRKIYMDWTGKELRGKAMPRKDEEGFYVCSTTGKKKKQSDPKGLRKTLKGWKPTSNFDIKENKYRYARVYVAYEDESDPSEYTWFIRKMEITRCEEVDSFWRRKS